MNLRHLEYFTEIAKQGSITAAAEKLYVSQSAVNQYLLKLEKELGVQLFSRNKKGLTLTEAGQIYLEGCKKILLLKADTYKKINDLTGTAKASLKVGLTPTRGLYMFSSVYWDMVKRFEEITITPIEMDARSQHRAIKNGEIDLGLLMIQNAQKDPELSYTELGSEEIMLLVPATHPACKDYPQGSSGIPAADLADFADMPFVSRQQGSTFRDVCDDIIEEAGFVPDILFETSNTGHLAEFAKTGQCCALVPNFYVDYNDPHYRVFSISTHPSWKLCIAYRNKAYLSKAARAFIEVSKKFWQNEKRFRPMHR